MKLRNKTAKEITLRPVHPNAGIEQAYQRKLLKLIDEMNKSVRYWLSASYKANEPIIAQDDALPSNALRAAIRKLAARWQKQFDEAAPALAEYFSVAVSERSDATLRSILKKGGFSVQFKMTKAQRDIFEATVNQNVALIKSIPSQYFTNVEGMVMRSVQTGRDLGSLTTDLQKEFGITRRRAAFFDPYHAAIAAEIARLRAAHPRIVLYDAHSIRSRIPRLFDGELPQFNIGTNGDVTCNPALTAAVSAACTADQVVNGRFKGGWTTRHYGQPANGVHAIQMELAIRGYAPEPPAPDEANWPPAFDPASAAPLAATLRNVLNACLDFAQ